MEIKEFKISVLPLRGKLYGYARKLVGNSDYAEDVTQDVLMKLWEKRYELEQYRSIEAFAMAMIHNACIDITRTEKTGLPLMEDILGDEKSSTGQMLEIRSEVELVKRIIDTLPDVQKLTIRMKDIDGYENEEIAEIAGCNIEAVRSNLSRARKRVREIYFQLIKERKIR